MTLKPLSYIPHAGIGNSYFFDGKYAESIPHYKKAVDLHITSAPLRVFLGRAYVHTRQYELALASLNEAVKNDPKFAESYYWLGLVYLAKRDIPSAKKQHSILLALDKGLQMLFQRRLPP